MMTLMNRTAGFTLIELVITVAIAAVLLALAAPSFVDTVANQRRASTVNELVEAINSARLEAVSQRRTVTLCSSNDSASDDPSCTDSDWDAGWLIFIDSDDDAVLGEDDAGYDRDEDGDIDEADALLRTHSALKTGNTLRSNTGSTLSFNAVGMTTNFGAFVYCDSRGFDESRVIVVGLGGRLRTVPGPEYDGAITSCDP